MAALTLVVLCCGCHVIFPFDLPQHSEVDSASHDAAPDHALSDAPRLDFPFPLDYSGDLGFPCTCEIADANGDGVVGGPDFALLQGCFGKPATDTCKRLDFNGDGVIGLPDLSCLNSVWGTTCPKSDGSLDGPSLDLMPEDLGVIASDGSISPAIAREWCCADASGTTAASASFTVNGPKRVLVAAVGILADQAVSDGMLALQVKCTTCPGSPSLFQAVKSANQVFRAQLWYLVDPPQGQHQVEVTSGYTGTKLAALITSVWSGVDTFQPFYNNNPTNKISGQNSGNFTLQLKAACPAGAVAVDGALWIGLTSAPTPGSGQKVNSLVDFSSFWLGSSYKYATPPSTTMSWSITTSASLAAVAECLKAAP